MRPARTLTIAIALAASLTMAPPAGADESIPVDDVFPEWFPKPPEVSARPGGAGPPDRLIGTVFEGDLPIEGWTDMGGGLLADPVWFSHYESGDGRHLVTVLWALPRRSGSQQATFQVTDVLVVPPLEYGLELSFFCRRPGQTAVERIIAVIRPDPRYQSEWWRDVRLAWTVALDSGRIGFASPAGIECANESWGE